MIQRIKRWVVDLSLNRKFTSLFFLLVVIPVAIICIISYYQLYRNTLDSRMFSANQSYEQTVSYLDYQLYRVYRNSIMVNSNYDLSTILQKKPDNATQAEQIGYYEWINDYIYSLEENQDLDRIVLYINDGFQFVGTNTSVRSISHMKTEPWYSEEITVNQRVKWLRTSEEYYGKRDSYITTVKPISSPNDFTETIAYVRMDIGVENINSMLQRSVTVEGQISYLQNEDGMILAESDADRLKQIDIPSDVIQKAYYGSEKGFVEIQDFPYLVRSQKVDAGKCYIVSLIPKNIIIEEARDLVVRMVVLAAFVLAVASGIFIFISHSIVRRIYLLNDAFSEVESGNMTYLSVTNMDEIGQLIINYNQMVQKLQELMKEQFATGQKITKMELKALQSQINPHFLYNTLELINCLARSGDFDKLQEIIEALSQYYRLTLSRGEDIITIHDEIKMCKAYILIQQRRFEGKIKFQYDVSPEILSYAIPKITLQPLVENAINHGIREKSSGCGTIKLGGKIENDEIVLCVADDGVGMIVEQSRMKKSTGNHYGVKNIEQRLCLYFGIKKALHYHSVPGLGTTVEIRIPKRQLGEKS